MNTGDAEIETGYPEYGNCDNQNSPVYSSNAGVSGVMPIMLPFRVREKSTRSNSVDMEVSMTVKKEEENPYISDSDEINFDNHNNFNLDEYSNASEFVTSVNSKRKLTDGYTTTPKNPTVPKDLQNIIISSNPELNIKFTYSQRMNTQMVVAGFLLKKRRGPYTPPTTGLRSISWKCVVDGCTYAAFTQEGNFRENESKRMHNHDQQPELFAVKEARLKLIKRLVEGEQIDDVIESTGPGVLDMIGSLDAIKQAANRYKRKMKDDVTDPVFVDPSSNQDQLEFCSSSAEGYVDKYNDSSCITRDSENPLEIVKKEPADFL